MIIFGEVVNELDEHPTPFPWEVQDASMFDASKSWDWTAMSQNLLLTQMLGVGGPSTADVCGDMFGGITFDTFGFNDAQYPSVVIELSQQKKGLAKLADDYIFGSDGDISVVVGLDIESSVESKRATVSTW